MKPISRRTVLKGAGVALSLPALQAMSPLAAHPSIKLAETGQGAPLRLAFVYVPNGIYMPDWLPERIGREYALAPSLEPLAGLREEFLLLSGLAHDKARANGDGPGDHARAAAAFLTAAQPFKSEGDRIHAGLSVDQLAARAIGGRTRLRSLELGCEAGRQSGQCDSGYACAYSNNISWMSASTPTAKETRPELVFDRLFATDQQGRTAEQIHDRLLSRRSILDLVRADARDLERRLGAEDRRRLDEYLQSTRELERRILSSLAPRAPLATERSARPRAGSPERPEEIEEYPDRVRAMYDLLALAFQTDSTRIATLMLANEGSGRTYPWIDVREGHHAASHHQNDPEKIDMLRRIDRFHTRELARFLKILRDTEEGSGRLLDHCMIVYGSGLADGNRHTHHDLPILLAGRGAGTLEPGAHLRFPRETPAANLFLALLDRLGISLPRFGDSTGRLSGLGPSKGELDGSDG